MTHPSQKPRRKRFAWPRFHGPELRGKRVIILGPASTVTDDIEGLDLSTYDVVARMNNAINTPITYRGQAYRYHNLYIRNQQKNTTTSFAGRLDRESAQASGTEMVLYTLMKWREILRLIRKVVAIWRMDLRLDIYVLTPPFIRYCSGLIAPHKPTLGFIALNYLLQSDAARVDVAGFTFFTTKYVDSYNDRVAQDADAMKWATRNGKHNPAAELPAFRKLYEQAIAGGKNIHLGEGVRYALYGDAPAPQPQGAAK